MKISNAILAASALLLLGSGAAQAADMAMLNCKKASHDIEKLICKTADLKARDQELGAVYKKVQGITASFADAQQAGKLLKAEQAGWRKGLNDCWKDSDKLACTAKAYDSRISELQTSYGLVEEAAPVSYTCNKVPADQMVVTSVAAKVPGVRIERGDSTEVALLAPSKDGKLYNGFSGVSLLLQGDKARLTWKDGSVHPCIKAK